MTDSTVAGGPWESTQLDDVDVLLVDDDERWARATGRLLGENHAAFSVDCVHSLAAGRERFETLDPDCVICDYQLGDGSGLDLLATVRETDPERPFVLVTGRGSEQVASDAIGGGVTDYIRKDMDDDAADLLASRVANAVHTYRTHRALARARRSNEDMLDVLTATTAKADVVQQFCTQLVEERGYACAWIGTAGHGGGVRPEASAGRHEYLEAVDLSQSRDGTGEPATVALARDEPVIVATIESARDEDLDGDDGDVAVTDDGDVEVAAVEDGVIPATEGDGWRREATEYGLASVFAMPIHHDGVRFGVLAVYGESSGIEPARRRALGEYADTIGYAMRTAEWKRSLLTDRPIAVDVSVADGSVPLFAFGDALTDDARVAVSSAVERGDGRTLYLAEIEGGYQAGIRQAGGAIDGLELLAVHGDRSPVRCELLADGPTPESVLADHGAQFERSIVDDSGLTISATVPDDGTLSTLSSALETAFERAEITKIWSEGAARTDRGKRGPLGDLTDRQREILRHAFQAGYFENPRDTSATELAERFDIARATLTQHLRTAERKVLTVQLTE